MIGADSGSAVICGRLFISRGGVAFIKSQTTLTYRGDKSTDKYQSHKNFPEVKKWESSGFIRVVSLAQTKEL